MGPFGREFGDFLNGDLRFDTQKGQLWKGLEWSWDTSLLFLSPTLEPYRTRLAAWQLAVGGLRGSGLLLDRWNNGTYFRGFSPMDTVTEWRPVNTRAKYNPLWVPDSDAIYRSHKRLKTHLSLSKDRPLNFRFSMSVNIVAILLTKWSRSSFVSEKDCLYEINIRIGQR